MDLENLDFELLECRFCSHITTKKDVIYETKNLLVIDTKTKFIPIHYIIITKTHMSQKDVFLNGEILQEINKIIELFFPKGTRIIINIGENGGQVEDHLHIHMFGGCQMRGFGL
jgi:histidine triad (HIT) family protein